MKFLRKSPLQTITVTRRIAAPVAAIFAMLADHEAYAQWPGMAVARLEQAGLTTRNGTGALRYLKSGPVWFREKITAFEPSQRMDYLIVDSLLPLEHKGASIRLREAGDGITEVVWTSTFRLRIPLVGTALTRLLARQMSQGFGGALKHVERQLGASR